MATSRNCVAQWSRGASSASFRPRLQALQPFLPLEQRRNAGGGGGGGGGAKKKKKKKGWKTFIAHDLKEMQQFALCDAMRYIRAFEVGSQRNPKYELHINLRTLKNGPVVRNRLRLPHPVKTEQRIAAICPPDSKAANQAKEAGAALVGEEDLIERIKAGEVNFDRLVCHEDSVALLNKSGVGRILGPKGLMPSAKTGTVVKEMGNTIRDMAGGSEYREKMGVVRLAIGGIHFTPEMLQRNVKTFMEQLKGDLAGLSDKISKELHEVVLSSANSPGFSLTGEFRSKDGIDPKELAKSIPA